MKASDKLIEKIKEFEGCRLYAYRDSVGVATIGYGHTRGVKMGMAITLQQAEKLLREDLVVYENAVNALGINFAQGSFDALVDFSYNLGVTNLMKSTLLKKVRANAPLKEIQYEFSRWNKAGGKVLPGLTKRRAWEAQRYGEKD